MEIIKFVWERSPLDRERNKILSREQSEQKYGSIKEDTLFRTVGQCWNKGESSRS